MESVGHERYRIPRAWSAEGQGNAWAVLPMTPLPSSLYRARFLWSGLCIARQVRALAMPSRWGEFVTPSRPTTRGFGHVDARSRWLCATRLDNVTPNTGQTPACNSIGGVSRPSNVRASDLIKSQWVLLLRPPSPPLRTTAKAFAKDVFINQERKLGARRRSDTVLVSTINDADQGSADVAFRTPPAPYEKSKSLGSGGSMVARLKLKGIDGRAPPGVEPAA
ncbi:hypothetical protein GQ457_18G009010 [Hibiscus cannabinus]